MEAMLASVILAMAVGAILMPFTAGSLNEQTDLRKTLAVSLAQEMMEEILSKPFVDPGGSTIPGPDSGETRLTFDGVKDYDGCTEPDGRIADCTGQFISGAAAKGLSRDVTVQYVTVSGQPADAKSFLRVAVTVSHHGQVLVRLTRLVYAMKP